MIRTEIRLKVGVKFAGLDTDIVLNLSEFDISFAKTNYAQICIWHGKINKIPAIFEHNFNLRSLYPKRKTFHISEFMAFMEIMSIYFYQIGENKTAVRYYDLMKQLDKNHPATKQTKRLIKPPFPLRILQKLFGPKDKIR